MPNIETYQVLGFPVAKTDYASAAEWIFSKASKGDRAYAVEAANTHVLALGRSDAEFQAAIFKFDLICPDGMPLVWSLNQQVSKEEQLKDRVYGPTLMLKTFELSAGTGLKHFVFGGKEETLEKLSANLKADYPDAELAGTYSPPFGEWPEDEFEKICRLIRESGATMVWVGLGCPKQEKWIGQNLDKLPPAVYFGIGAAIAFHAGEVKQAPSFIQKCGMEWLFRLLMEPKRLWKRYFVYNSLFLYYLVRDRMSDESFTIATTQDPPV